MKLSLILLVYLLCNTLLYSQERTLIDMGEGTGGFGGAVLKVTSVRNQAALIAGGRGGWIFNHSFILGGGLYGTLSEVDAAEGALPVEGPLDISLSYWGLELEYIFNSNKLLHYNTYILIGAGAVRYIKDVGSVFESKDQAGETDLVFALEPAVNAELNIATWCRVSAGLSYRLITGVNQPGMKNTDLNGFAGSLIIKFGNF